MYKPAHIADKRSDETKTHANRAVRDSYRRQAHHVVGGGHSYYWNKYPREITLEEWDRAAALKKRFARFVHYVEEVLPEWEEIDRTYWADNSITVQERCKCGEHKRSRMTSPPAGDVCF